MNIFVIIPVLVAAIVVMGLVLRICVVNRKAERAAEIRRGEQLEELNKAWTRQAQT